MGEPMGCCLWGRTESDTTEATLAAAAAAAGRGGHGRSQGLFTAYFGFRMLDEWRLHSLNQGRRARLGGKIQVKL